MIAFSINPISILLSLFLTHDLNSSKKVFFRNGISVEPCNAETSCYQADMYLDDNAGAMSIYGNIMIKDKILQQKPPNKDFAKVKWLGILFNGGADTLVYENVFFGPEDGQSNGAIYRDQAAFYEQTSGGTYWPDGKSCGNTGICEDDEFYKTMRKYKYTKDPWKSVFPELLTYDAKPDKGSKWYCANTRSCPLASWNNTVVCNAAVGSNRQLANRVIWPSDPESDESSEAEEGVNVPKRSKAVIERGNKPGSFFDETIESVDVIEKKGMQSCLSLAKRIAEAGEATQNNCDTGTRPGATRIELAGRFNNLCTESWAVNGLDSCDPCEGTQFCAPRDLSPSLCACGSTFPDPKPTPIVTARPTPAPNSGPTKNPTSGPTLAPVDDISDQCMDDSEFRYKNDDAKDCNWVGEKKKKRCAEYQKGTNEPLFKYCPTSCDAVGVDDPNFKWKGEKKKDCDWVRKDPSKYCTKEYGGSGRVFNFCPEACDACSDPVETPYIVYSGKGYCDQTKEKTIKSVTSSQECWNQCREKHDWDFAEFTDGVCFCQKSCPCMSSVGENNIIAILPANVSPPEKC